MRTVPPPADERDTGPSAGVVVELSERIDRAGQAEFSHPKSRHCGKTVAWIAEHDDSESEHYLTWYLRAGLDAGLKREITIFLRARHPELLGDEAAA